MRKITTDYLFKKLKKNLLLIIIPAIIVFGLVLSQTLIKGSSSYEATSMLMVTGSSKDEPISYNNIILNEKLANIYSQFLESNDLYEKVGKVLDADIEADDIKSNLEYDVNPQGGVISFTYVDKNKDRAIDTLTLISEEFRNYARDFLNMDNIDYLQKPIAEQPSKIKGLIFSILGLIAGFLLGILLLILKEIMTDKIDDKAKIADLGIPVLADMKDYEDCLYKSKVNIKNLADNQIIGITSIKKDKDSYKFSKDLALNLGKSLGVCLVDTRAFDGEIDKKYQSEINDIKLLRYKGIDLIKLNADSREILDSNEFEEKIFDLKNSYNHIILSESSLADVDPIITCQYEDAKIIIVDDKKIKTDQLISYISEIESLGVKVLGVIYNI